MSGTRFIAATDQTGAVFWVWRFAINHRIARPLERLSLFMSELSHVSAHGATAEAVADWFGVQNGQAT